MMGLFLWRRSWGTKVWGCYRFLHTLDGSSGCDVKLRFMTFYLCPSTLEVPNRHLVFAY